MTPSVVGTYSLSAAAAVIGHITGDEDNNLLNGTTGSDSIQ